MIFVDSNVPMYLVGSDEARKAQTKVALTRLVGRRLQLVTSSEVFQEILHRYTSIDRRDAIQPAFDVLCAAVDRVLPVDESDVHVAKDLVLARAGLTARDAVHVAVMQHHEIEEILTFDRGFDAVPGIRRLPG